MRLILTLALIALKSITVTAKDLNELSRAQLEQAATEIEDQLAELSPFNPIYQNSNLGFHSSYIPVEGISRESDSVEEPLWTITYHLEHFQSKAAIQAALIPAIVNRDGQFRGYGFPKRFKIVGKGQDFHRVFVDYSKKPCQNPGQFPLLFDLDTSSPYTTLELQVFEGVRESGFEFFAIGEWKVFAAFESERIEGRVPNAHIRNIAGRLPISSNQSFDHHSFWSLNNIKDNHTSLGIPLAANVTGSPDLLLRFDEQLKKPIDLYYAIEDKGYISHLDFFPGKDPKRSGFNGLGFPRDLSVHVYREWSEEDQSPKQKVHTISRKKISLPSGNNTYTLKVGTTTGKCIQVSIEELREYEGIHTLQLSELAIVGINQHVGKLVHVEGLPEEQAKQLQLLHDRSAHGHSLISRYEWVQQLALRGQLERRHLGIITQLASRENIRNQALTKGFIAFAIVLISSLIAWLILTKIRTRRAEHAFREQLASDLHDDVGALLGCSMLAAQKLQRSVSSEKSLKEVNRIIETNRKASQALRDIVWINNRQQSSLDDLINKIHELAHQFSDYYQLKLETKNNEKWADLELPVRTRRDVFLFTKECLNNIHKHSSATQIHISINIHQGQMELVINDNGRGFDPQSKEIKQSTGFGLNSMKRRSEQLKGILKIDTFLGSGTEINLKFPLRNA